MLFWGTKGAWEGRKIFHNLILVFPKENNLEQRGTSNPEGRVLLKHNVETKSISLSYPILRGKCASWSLVDDTDQYWSIIRTVFPRRAKVNLPPQLFSLPYPLPTCYFFKGFIYSFLDRGAGREKERERKIGVWENHWSVASCMHLNWGPGPQPKHVPWPGIKLVTFCFVGWLPSNYATQIRAAHMFLMKSTTSLPPGPRMEQRPKLPRTFYNLATMNSSGIWTST